MDINPEKTGHDPEYNKGGQQGNHKAGYAKQYGVEVAFLHCNESRVPTRQSVNGTTNQTILTLRFRTESIESDPVVNSFPA
jgi:hypothetical protein